LAPKKTVDCGNTSFILPIPLSFAGERGWGGGLCGMRASHRDDAEAEQ